MPSRLANPLLAGLLLVLAACASVPVAPPAGTLSTSDQPFAIDGRLSARRGSYAVTVSFAWTHTSPRDALVVTTPLGQAVAEITSDASVPLAEMRMADGRHVEASDWSRLTERVIGFPLPVEGLAWWVRGTARAEAPHSAEFDASGRLDVLRQDGCEIVYGYADDSMRRPSRLRLVCNDLELRIVIDRWRAA